MYILYIDIAKLVYLYIVLFIAKSIDVFHLQVPVLLAIT